LAIWLLLAVLQLLRSTIFLGEESQVASVACPRPSATIKRAAGHHTVAQCANEHPDIS